MMASMREPTEVEQSVARSAVGHAKALARSTNVEHGSASASSMALAFRAVEAGGAR